MKDYTSLISDFTAEMNEILFKHKHAKLIHQIYLGGHEVMGRVFKSISGTLTIAQLIGFMFTGYIVMRTRVKLPRLGNFMFGVSFFLSVILVCLIFVSSSI